MYGVIHRVLARLIAAFLGVALLLPGSARLRPQVRLLEPVTTESRSLHFEVSSDAGWYFDVENYTLEREEDGVWQNVPLKVFREETAAVFSLFPLSDLVRRSRSFETYIHFDSALGHPLPAGHYRLSVMQDDRNPAVLAVGTFDVTEAAS